MAETTTFNYTISDGVRTSTATVTVDIADVDVAVIAQNDSGTAFNTTQGTLKNHPVLANDSPTGVIVDAITVAPNQGGTTAIVSGGSSINYTPASGFTGTETYTYRAKHPSGPSTDTAIVTVQVSSSSGPVNRSGLPWKSGVWTFQGGGWETNLITFKNFRGRDMDILETFTGSSAYATWATLTGADFIYNKWRDANQTVPGDIYKMLAAGYNVAHAQALLPSSNAYQFTNLKSGMWDSQHQTIANKIAAWYKPATMPQLYIRLGWEANSDYPWGFDETKGTSGDRANYSAAYARIGWIYKDTIPGIKLCWNHLQDRNWNMNFYFPTNSRGSPVDIIGCDPYDNQYFQGGWRDTNARFDEWVAGTFNSSTGVVRGPDGFRRYAKSLGKKTSFDEWGPTNASVMSNRNTPSLWIIDGSNNSVYSARFYDYMLANAADIEFDVHFNFTDPHRIEPVIRNAAGTALLPLARAAYLSRWHP
jgi:Bacterial Ig domain